MFYNELASIKLGGDVKRQIIAMISLAFGASSFAAVEAQPAVADKLYLCEIRDMAYIEDDGKIGTQYPDWFVQIHAKFAFDLGQKTFRWSDGDSTPDAYQVLSPTPSSTNVLAVRVESETQVQVLEIETNWSHGANATAWPFSWLSWGNLYSGMCRVF